MTKTPDLKLNKDKLQRYLAWDYYTWSKPLSLWYEKLNEYNAQGHPKPYGLEVGANRGGISLFFAVETGSQMVCSDVFSPQEKAGPFHQPFLSDTNAIKYAEANALALPFADNTFDFVTFKSVLGYFRTRDDQKKMIEEIYRVLKPGGYLFFSENSKGHKLHQWARRTFIPWGNKWDYLTKEIMLDLLSPFRDKIVKETGFVSLFTSRTPFKLPGYILDNVLNRLIADTQKYIHYGYAIK
jgi:SAM-dependent methyltransferase